MRKSRSWFMRQKEDIKEKLQNLVRGKMENQITRSQTSWIRILSFKSVTEFNFTIKDIKKRGKYGTLKK